MQVLLVGNKTDLEQERQVTTEEGRLFAKKEGLNFLEISAKDYRKVEAAFNQLGENILKLL
jgi:GTPase SAR1 family protein